MENQKLIFSSSDLPKDDRQFMCDICNKYLSVAPILYNETVGTVCGRCFQEGETKKFIGLTFESQNVYEEFAKQLNFPCSYRSKGCGEKLEWNEVTEHEEVCLKREDKCILGNNELLVEKRYCKWSGNSKELIQHLKDMHKEHFLKLPSMEIGPEYDNRIILSEFVETLFVSILYVDHGTKSFFFHVLMDTFFIQCKNFTFDLEISDGEGKRVINFPQNEVNSLSNRAFSVNSLKCGFCIDISTLHALLKSDHMKLYFKFKTNKNSVSMENLESRNLIFNWTCHNCSSILIPPIYMCENNHNICSDCKDTYPKCSCEAAIIDSLNVTLDKLAKLSLYHCKNKDDGCDELLDFQNISLHQMNCMLTTKQCVFGCSWKGNNFEMLNHIRQKHSFINLKEAIPFELNAPVDRFCTLFEEIIFVLSFVYRCGENLLISVEYLGLKRENFQFEFCIESGPLKLKICHLCSPFSEYEPNHIDIPYDFLKQFLTEQRFFFRVDIFNMLKT